VVFNRTQLENIMNESERCARPSCKCQVPLNGPFGKYCTEHCHEGKGLTEVKCDRPRPGRRASAPAGGRRRAARDRTIRLSSADRVRIGDRRGAVVGTSRFESRACTTISAESIVCAFNSILPPAMRATSKRFREVVVRARLHALDARFLAGSCREEDDGNRSHARVCAEPSQEPEAIQPRHHHIRHDEVWARHLDGDVGWIL
jgi:hypothetical protein